MARLVKQLISDNVGHFTPISIPVTQKMPHDGAQQRHSTRTPCSTAAVVDVYATIVAAAVDKLYCVYVGHRVSTLHDTNTEPQTCICFTLVSTTGVLFS